LQAILSLSSEGHSERAEELRELALELIVPNSRQPRERFDEGSLRGLADSVRERGVLQPVLVRPKAGGSFELIAGERRWRAARMAGLTVIPALVRERADAEALELALIENMAREDLSPVEQARACTALVEELGLTREDVGRRVGRSRVAVSNLMRLLDLPEEAIELLHSGTLSEGHGRALLLAHDHAARRPLARRAAAEGWSVRTTEERARESNASSERERPSRALRTAPAGDPDRDHAVQQVAETLSEALRAEVHVTPLRGGGYRAELTFATPQEAIEFARRLRGLDSDTAPTPAEAPRRAIRSVR
jgi:ParB family chromosome partitioning protein